MSRNLEVQKAFRVLHAEADRLLTTGCLEQRVMHGQLNWMRVLLIGNTAVLEAEDELMATLNSASVLQRPIPKRGKRTPKPKLSTIQILEQIKKD